MPTESFDKQFVVTDPKAIEKFKKDLENPKVIKVKRPKFASPDKASKLLKDYLKGLK